MAIEEFSVPIESGLRPLTEEERAAEEFTAEEEGELRQRLQDIDACQLNPYFKMPGPTR